MLIAEAFRKHVESVEKLMNFDREILDFAIENIEKLHGQLRVHHKLDNPQLTAARTLEMLKGFRAHDSQRPKYKTIFNQALVLLVSYFGSSVHDLFRHGIAAALLRDTDSALLREQVKLTFRELRDAEFQLQEMAPDLLVQAKDISFQDMQSIARAFKEYLGITIEHTQYVDEIILGQACRHIIVHAGGIVNKRLLNQLSSAKTRTLKPVLSLGECVEFSVEEVSKVADAMVAYIVSVERMVKERGLQTDV